MDKETIICAAIWYKEVSTPKFNCINIDEGTVICGHRHSHCISTMKAISNLRTVTFAEDATGEHIQGFLTNKNRFVDREEGAKIALESGQIEKLNYSSKELFSEDLY